MVTLLVWPWFGKVEALLRESNVAFESGTQTRMETERDTRKTGLFWPLLFVPILFENHIAES